MAFFERFGKKVSKTGQGALKKTKSMAEKAKINAQIASENKAIRDNYSMLGRRYYELFGGAPDDDLAEFVAAIRDAMMNIDRYRAQIQKIKGVERCPACGADLSDGAVFCTACGTKLIEPPPAEAAERDRKSCPNCGSEIADNASYCGSCGAKAG